MEDAEQERREEPAQPAKGADEASHRARVFREVLRHQLEDGAVAESHEHRAPKRTNGERHHGRPRQEQREQGDATEDPRQHLGAAYAVRQPSADWPHEGGEHDEPRGPESSVRGSEAELRAQQCRQVDRERDEAAEGQKVEGAEQPGSRRAPQDGHHRGDGGGATSPLGIPRQQEVRHRPRQKQRAGAAKHHFPAKTGRYYRADEDSQRLAHRPQAVNAERRALASRQGPAGYERRANCEGRPGHADQERRADERAIAAG